MVKKRFCPFPFPIKAQLCHLSELESIHVLTRCQGIKIKSGGSLNKIFHK
jgi:hypothetical protein